MRLMPHQVLQKLSENSRNRAQQELAVLNRQRQALVRHIVETESHLKELEEQREQTLRVGAQAGLLVVFDEMLAEQRQQTGRMKEALEQLHPQEKILLNLWLEADQRSKTFDRMDARLRSSEQRILERQQQRLDDDRAIAAGI